MSEFAAIKLTETVYWVGAIDWELRNFHGYNTARGTTYNAYLIMGEKPILIDTVRAPFYREMMARIKSVIDPSKISYIISNHAEMDHSGCLVEAIAAINPEQVFVSKMGAQALKQHFQIDISLTEVKNTETIILGNSQLTFVETKMLHWPDSMFTFYGNDGVLFSQDGFGMHLATTKLCAADNSRAILQHEAAKYYANILLPYSQLVANLLQKFPEFKFNVKMVAPDHGPVWSTLEDISWIIGLWNNWAQQKVYNKAVIVYDTMWHSTEAMAHSIADGLINQDITVKVLPLTETHRSDIALELLEAGALIVGSPTLNQQPYPTIAEALCYLKGLKRKNLLGMVFGSYGWGGEAVQLIQKELADMQIEIVAEPLKVKYVPTAEDLMKCREIGQTIAERLKP